MFDRTKREDETSEALVSRLQELKQQLEGAQRISRDEIQLVKAEIASSAENEFEPAQEVEKAPILGRFGSKCISARLLRTIAA